MLYWFSVSPADKQTELVQWPSPVSNLQLWASPAYWLLMWSLRHHPLAAGKTQSKQPCGLKPDTLWQCSTSVSSQKSNKLQAVFSLSNRHLPEMRCRHSSHTGRLFHELRGQNLLEWIPWIKKKRIVNKKQIRFRKCTLSPSLGYLWWDRTYILLYNCLQ